ncbi:MAG: hypothetical protein ACRC01_04850 [Deefgea sp.]
MAAPVVLSSRKVNPLSLASAIRRTAGQNEVHAKLAQYQAQTQQVRAVAKETAIAQQTEQAERKAVSLFPHISTLAMMQLVPMRPVSTARVMEYEAMAVSLEQDDIVGLGKVLDMHA